MENNFSILCIDDDPTILDILTQNLSHYNLFATTLPFEGLEILTKNYIDLILLDINMPELNGFNVCQMIKNENNFKDIPIIFITSSISDEDIHQAFSSGGVDYIKKPINMMELKQRVKNHLNLRHYSLQLQKEVQNEYEKNMKTEQILLHKSELLNAVKLYLSKQASKPLVKSDFQRVIQDSIKLLKVEQNEPIIDLVENYRWDKNSSILYHNDMVVKLKTSESNLLELFILKKNQKISLMQIHIYLWGDSSATFNATSVRNIVTSLRKKLPQNLITTVYGGDYIFKIKCK
jgi:DNA-binding response OmpR family regulator